MARLPPSLVLPSITPGSQHGTVFPGQLCGRVDIPPSSSRRIMQYRYWAIPAITAEIGEGNMQLRMFDVPVDGGELRVLQWGTGRRVAVAVHGITASAMAWQAVARQMPAGWTLAAPDLRGRGFSAQLPGP